MIGVLKTHQTQELSSVLSLTFCVSASVALRVQLQVRMYEDRMMVVAERPLISSWWQMPEG